MSKPAVTVVLDDLEHVLALAKSYASRSILVDKEEFEALHRVEREASSVRELARQ